MSDLISRQAVNKIIDKWLSNPFYELKDHIYEMAKKIHEIPSVEIKGEWIFDKSIYNWRCSRCNQTPPPTGCAGSADFMATHFKFCSHCGAEMRREE